jgi:alpha-galactosidase
MAWLLELKDGSGRHLLPELRQMAIEKNHREKHDDMVRFDYLEKLGYYCTESSEHNAEYNPFYIKAHRPDLIEAFNIPLDEYPRRCEEQIRKWDQQWQALTGGSTIEHTRTGEYASRIMEAMVTNVPYKIGGNVLNHGVIPNLPWDACVEVPCLVDANGVTPTYVGELPLQLAAMNATNIYPQLLTIEAAHTGNRETIYQAAMLDPHTAAQLSTDEIVSLCDELIEAHGRAGYPVL